MIKERDYTAFFLQADIPAILEKITTRFKHQSHSFRYLAESYFSTYSPNIRFTWLVKENLLRGLAM